MPLPPLSRDPARDPGSAWLLVLCIGIAALGGAVLPIAAGYGL